MENILGYKCFDEEMKNCYGKQFEVGKIYIDYGNPTFGKGGHGFHMCKNLEDTLRYFDGVDKKINICLVIGSGKISTGFDDYNEYYDMYSVEKLKIIKKLSRNEIISLALNLDEVRIKRFIMSFRLTKEEIIKFKEKFKYNNEVIKFIEYYQENNKNAFEVRTPQIRIKKY